jgi:hypothetical protein
VRLDARIAIGCRTCCLVTLAAIVSGCQPSAPVLPMTGEIRLEFVPTAGTDMRFKLTNQSSRVLSLRGSYKRSVGANPWDAWMECLEPAINSWTEGPYAMVDGEAGGVEVGIGEQLDLFLGFDHHQKFVEDYKGGRCKLKLKLTDGSVITSDEFQP